VGEHGPDMGDELAAVGQRQASACASGPREGARATKTSSSAHSSSSIPHTLSCCACGAALPPAALSSSLASITPLAISLEQPECSV
jgi:hypothetical protein